MLVVGVMATGAGPHAGDQGAARNGLDTESISQVHAETVFFLLGLVVAAWLALRAAGAQHAAGRALLLLGVSLAQGLVGFVQYFTHLPVILVGTHMLGSTIVWLATLALVWAVRVRPATLTRTSRGASSGAAQAEPCNASIPMRSIFSSSTGTARIPRRAATIWSARRARLSAP